MNNNQEVLVKFFENDKEILLAGIKEEIEERVTKETKKKLVIKFYNEGVSLKIISEACDFPISEVEKIINDYLREKDVKEATQKEVFKVKKEMIIELYNQGVSLDIISNASKYPISKVEKIIKDNKN